MAEWFNKNIRPAANRHVQSCVHFKLDDLLLDLIGETILVTRSSTSNVRIQKRNKEVRYALLRGARNAAVIRSASHRRSHDGVHRIVDRLVRMDHAGGYGQVRGFMRAGTVVEMIANQNRTAVKDIFLSGGRIEAGDGQTSASRTQPAATPGIPVGDQVQLCTIR
jgi:hypothetical protein